MFQVVFTNLSLRGCRALRCCGLFSLLIYCLPQPPVHSQGLLRDETRHPDGVLGKPSLMVEVAYASVSGEEGYHFDDLSTGLIVMKAVLAPSLVFGVKLQADRQDGSTHSSAAGILQLYLGNPMSARDAGDCNPDGRVGRPVLQLVGDAEFAEGNRSVDRWSFDGAILLPMSSYLTLGAGYRWVEEVRPDDALSGYGVIRWYPRPYSNEAFYQNPDGLPGTLNFALLAGASSEGTVGRLDIAVPLDGSTTVGIGAGAVSFDARSERRLIARVQLTWYPR